LAGPMAGILCSKFFFSCSNGCKVDFALMNLTKIRQNHQLRQADFALKNLAKIRQNHQFHQADFKLILFWRF